MTQLKQRWYTLPTRRSTQHARQGSTPRRRVSLRTACKQHSPLRASAEASFSAGTGTVKEPKQTEHLSLLAKHPSYGLIDHATLPELPPWRARIDALCVVHEAPIHGHRRRDWPNLGTRGINPISAPPASSIHVAPKNPCTSISAVLTSASLPSVRTCPAHAAANRFRFAERTEPARSCRHCTSQLGTRLFVRMCRAAPEPRLPPGQHPDIRLADMPEQEAAGESWQRSQSRGASDRLAPFLMPEASGADSQRVLGRSDLHSSSTRRRAHVCPAVYGTHSSGAAPTCMGIVRVEGGCNLHASSALMSASRESRVTLTSQR